MRRHTTPTTSGNVPPTWEHWVRDAIRSAGYDIDSPRGDKVRLSEESGIPLATISRMLAGSVPKTETLAILARHLKGKIGPVAPTLRDMLIQSGKVAEDDLPLTAGANEPHPVPSRQPLTPEEVAVVAGVDPEDRGWFTAMVRRHRRHNRADKGGGGAVASGE
ncbi:transcriptional regulator [Streptomyces sp. NPDC092296]|uniref:transcriptional regulator n=1 Tax=Streptomyces sp. NPDC092296 TaxID=3366012 RepID=UPI0037F32867